jgi:hypothetical protein
MSQAQSILKFKEVQKDLLARKRWAFANTKRNERCPCNFFAFSKKALGKRLTKVFGKKFKVCCWGIKS